MRSSPAGRIAAALAVACALWAPRVQADSAARHAELVVGVEGRAVESPIPEPLAPVAWAQALAPITVENANTNKRAPVRLYRASGEIDPDGLEQFLAIANDRGMTIPPHVVGTAPFDVSEALDRRLVQLVIKASYYFGGKDLVVISAFRPTSRGGGGKHATHEAIDFKIRGVSAAALAAHLRTYPRAGVGVYTNPKTQYVHLDVRDPSFHWLDASPPGKTWREAQLADRGRVMRDASYTPTSDLPLARP
jgi:uncharacterized protein YcbK (DUF882 family)